MLRRFPFVQQRDAMQCGIACLAMVCRYHGREISFEELSDICFATTEGVSMLGISRAAEILGFETGCFRASVDSLAEMELPAILHWNQNHFVVLVSISKNGKRFTVADPGKGMVKYSRAEFEKHWLSSGNGDDRRGIVMKIQPGKDFHADKGGKSEKRSFGFLFGYLKEYRRHILFVLLALLAGSALQLVMPFLTQAIVDRGIRDKDIGLIWLILLGELMIVFGRTAADFFRRFLLLHVSMKINIALVSDFFIKLLKLPMSFFDTKLMGDLLQRIGDHARVQNFLTGQLLNILFSLLTFIVFGVVLLSYNALIFGIFIAGSLCYGLWIAVFLRRRKVLDYELFEQEAKNQNKTYQFITAMQEIKLQDCELRRRREWEDVQAGLFGIQLKSLRLQQTQQAGSVFINEVKNIVITVIAATAVIKGDMTLGAMLAVQYIIGQLNSPVEQFMSFIYSLQDVKISLERINEVHEAKNEECGGMQAKSFNGEREIALTNVSFKYDPHSLKNTLSDISVDIPAGKVTAIVGASGSGKTTLIKLMLGYYPVASGAISIAGRNINDYNLKWWRRRCGVVMQEGVIFSESIARNIAVDDGEIDSDRLEKAARIACIHDFIKSLPLGYDTLIGRDGTGLSQGQKQRILIARAVYKNPDFIFLDEATNSLDTKNERAIVENLEEFYKGKTVVVVAHRLSTVRNADRIIVLDRGRIVETGTHEELITRKGPYFDLIRNQLELGN